MVSQNPDFNFHSVIDEFFAVKPPTGPHADLLRQLVRARAQELFANPDVRYMPAFKILDLLAAMVNIATAVAEESQLRPQEAAALVREALSDRSASVRQFVLDAALERARYEPMMIVGEQEELSHRDLALQKRWAAMLQAHQALEPLPEGWVEILTQAVDTVIAAEEFHAFRQGPLLQLFAEMLQTARHLQREGGALAQLETALDPNAPLWKRYALKVARYGEKPDDSPGTLPPESRIPQPPSGRNQVH
jgi:hypothetical protein